MDYEVFMLSRIAIEGHGPAGGERAPVESPALPLG
jgi:hypothetical protein